MKNKKFLIGTSIFLSVMLAATIIPTSIAISKAFDENTPREFTADITPTKPGRGETVSFLPESLAKYWQMEDLLNHYQDNLVAISELTPYTTELASWTSHMGSSESEKNIRRAIFDKYDIYRPTNNVLSWDSKISAKNYKVIISQNKDFATIEREYTVSGTENSVVFENPQTATTYYWQVIATKNDDSEVYSDIFSFETANLPRTINLEGVSNTRDWGGNVGQNGKRTKEGLVYRGMGLEAITSKGEDEFKNKLGIKTEIDLRNIGEGTENYLGLDSYYHCPSPYDYVEGVSGASYIDFTGEGSLITNFGNAIKVMANKNNYPVYFHCSVGRDRTGWFGICLNLLCGVSEEVIFKEFNMSLFSTSGALPKGNMEILRRYIRMRNYINTFSGDDMSEKMENYLVTLAGVTHEECVNVRNILLGNIDTGFVPGTVNPHPYTGLAKVTFRRYGQTPIIKMVEIGSLLEDPNVSGNGAWYHGNVLWDFEHDVVTEDMYLDYIAKDKCKVVVHYSGINLPDDAFDIAYNTQLDFSIFNRDGYTFKVYDDTYHRLESLLIEDDISINVAYSPINGYVPKGNSRIIVMAGQSNGAGVGHYPYLEESLDASKIAEINAGYDNVLMMGYSHMTYMNEFEKVYADRHSASAFTPGTFGFEVGLADRLSKAFPDETTYIVKYAHGGTSLNYDWISPSSADTDVVVPYDPSYERGWLYNGLVGALTNAIQTIEETTNTIPMVEAFMWMQGENDASYEASLNLYLSSFNNLVNDFTTTFANNISYKFAVYDAAIAETYMWQFAKQINGIKRSRVDDRNVYIETNDRITTLFEPIGASTDAAHYDAACYIDLGHMFADAYLTKTLKGYTVNTLEIEAPEKITLTMGQNYTIHTPDVLYNNSKISAKMSYFAEQHSGMSTVYSYFTVNNDGTLTPTRLGESRLRITAYYNHEVRTVLVPVEVVNS